MSEINWIDDIKRIYVGHWFSKGAMRFFSTRICADGRVFGNRYFVTSEKGPDGVRRYSVREYDRETDSIGTVGDFGAFSRRETAMAYAKHLANETSVSKGTP